MANIFMTALKIYNVHHLKDMVLLLSKEECKDLILTERNVSEKMSALKVLGQFMKETFSIVNYTQKVIYLSMANSEREYKEYLSEKFRNNRKNYT